MKRYKSKFSEAKTKLDLDLAEKILEWLQKNPYPADKQVHDFAESIKIEHSDLEAQIYAILSNIITGGKSKGVMPKDASQKEIDLGMLVEVEHSSISFIQRKITADHIKDRKDYYSFGKEFGIFDEI